MTPASRLVSLAVLVLVLGLAACDGKSAGDRSSGDRPADHTFTVRGAVQSLPGKDGLVYIKHEAIDEFVGRDGKVAPMAAMTMPFALRPGVALTGVEAGSKVQLQVEVRWSERPALQIASLNVLPAETKLNLGGAL